MSHCHPYLTSSGDVDLLDQVVDNGEWEDDGDEERHCKDYCEDRPSDI